MVGFDREKERESLEEKRCRCEAESPLPSSLPCRVSLFAFSVALQARPKGGNTISCLVPNRLSRTRKREGEEKREKEEGREERADISVLEMPDKERLREVERGEEERGASTK